MKRFRHGVWFAVFALLGIAAARGDELPRAKPADNVADAPAKTGPPKSPARRVYVLHSGVHTILANPNKNIFAESMRDMLKKRGIADQDIVVLENPYPTAGRINPFPIECLRMFMASARPDSKVVVDAYTRMDAALKKQEVNGNDNLVLIGHSAGGQMCLTLAHLACKHATFPDLAKCTGAYHIDMVVTLGAPIASNGPSSDVKVRHYLSPRDGVPRFVVQARPFLRVLGYDAVINVVPAKLSDACKVRMFLDIDHPKWDTEERVVDRILAESNPGYCAAWQMGMCYPCLPLCPVQFLCQALDCVCHIAIEDPPRLRK
jgi:hypothetical protein